MWRLIAAAAAGICIYQILAELLRGKYAILETRLDEIAGIGEKSQKQVKRWEGSLMNRAGKAALGRLSSTVGSVIPVSRKEKQRIAFLMARAGLKILPEEYMVLQILSVLGGAVLGLYLGLMFNKNLLLSGVAGLYAGYTLFRLFFRQRTFRRQNGILEQLPELLDLLSISVEAGLSFNQAFQYIAEQCEGPLVEEFVFAGRAMALGRSRRAALEDMSYRCGLDEVQTFASAVIQADEMGISLRNILVTQAAEARNAKRMRTEERAQKVPIKMLLPMALLIFPVLLIILMAPAVPQIMTALM